MTVLLIVLTCGLLEGSHEQHLIKIGNIREDLMKSVELRPKNYATTDGKPNNSDGDSKPTTERSVYQENRYDSPSLKTIENDIVKPLIVSLVLVVDHNAYQMLGKDVNRVNQYCIQLVSHMNFHFSKLFLKIILVNIIIWSKEDAFDISHDILRTMKDFSDYNKHILLKIRNHSHAQLITGKEQFDDLNRLNFGRAQINTICTDASSSVVMLHDLNNPAQQAVTNTHELAHSLNIKHTGRKCPGCIMSPEADRNLTAPADKWTVGNIQDFTGIVEKKSCLFDEEPTQQYESNTKYTTTYRTGDSCNQTGYPLNIWHLIKYFTQGSLILVLFLFCLNRHRSQKMSINNLIV